MFKVFDLKYSGDAMGEVQYQSSLDFKSNIGRQSRKNDSAANRLIGEVVQSRRRPLLGPSNSA